MMKENRAELVKAMELLARSINDEEVFELWLMDGVADGDIDHDTTDEEIEEMGYCDDKMFSELMDTFLHCMKNALKSGGLYYDGIVG